MILRFFLSIINEKKNDWLMMSEYKKWKSQIGHQTLKEEMLVWNKSNKGSKGVWLSKVMSKTVKCTPINPQYLVLP